MLDESDVAPLLCVHAFSYTIASLQAGGLGDRLAEAAAHATDPLSRQGAFEAYTALMKDIAAPIEPFVAAVLSTILDKCSDKVLCRLIYI